MELVRIDLGISVPDQVANLDGGGKLLRERWRQDPLAGQDREMIAQARHWPPSLIRDHVRAEIDRPLHDQVDTKSEQVARIAVGLEGLRIERQAFAQGLTCIPQTADLLAYQLDADHRVPSRT